MSLIADRPTLIQLLDNTTAKAKNIFRHHGKKVEFPFDTTSDGSKPEEVSSEEWETLEQARAVLMQDHILREYVIANDAANAAYHALILARHLSDLDEVLAKQDNPS